MKKGDPLYVEGAASPTESWDDKTLWREEGTRPSSSLITLILLGGGKKERVKPSAKEMEASNRIPK